MLLSHIMSTEATIVSSFLRLGTSYMWESYAIKYFKWLIGIDLPIEVGPHSVVRWDQITEKKKSG